MKICSKCGEEKECVEFHRNKISKDGFNSQCKKCVNAYHKNRRGSEKRDLKYYINLMNKIHNSKYLYPNINDEFIRTNSKITIFCKVCNYSFTQNMSHHIWSKSGCSRCYGNLPNTIDKIIKKSDQVHGIGRYSFPNIMNENISSHSKISIKCENCGDIFRQKVSNHINNKNGCHRCSKSKKEQLIHNYFIYNKINFIPQYKFDKCKYKRRLSFDFYLIDINMCVEYDGEQHYKPRRDDVNGEKLKLLKIKDEIKNNFCEKNNIKLRRISYKENLESSLNSILIDNGMKILKGFKEIQSIFIKKEGKECTLCGEYKKFSEYHRCSSTIDGYKSRCRYCRNKTSREKYNKNKNNVKC